LSESLHVISSVATDIVLLFTLVLGILLNLVRIQVIINEKEYKRNLREFNAMLTVYIRNLIPQQPSGGDTHPRSTRYGIDEIHVYMCAGLTVDTGKVVFIFNAAMAKYYTNTIF